VCECDRKASTMRRPWPTRGCCVMEKKVYEKSDIEMGFAVICSPINTIFLSIQVHASFAHTPSACAISFQL
jgi:hypothetical protein